MSNNYEANTPVGVYDNKAKFTDACKSNLLIANSYLYRRREVLAEWIGKKHAVGVFSSHPFWTPIRLSPSPEC